MYTGVWSDGGGGLEAQGMLVATDEELKALMYK